MIDAKVGDLVKHIDIEKYGIIIRIAKPNTGRGAYYVILWAGHSQTDWIWNDMVEKVTE